MSPTRRLARTRTALIVLVAAVGLGLAAPASAVKPTKSEKRQARAECRIERGVTRAERLEFAAEYGTRRPFRRCVSLKARELAVERRLAYEEALQGCRLERQADPVEFAQEYPGPRPLHQCVRAELI